MQASITLRVDGEERSLRADTRTTLLDALREQLGVTSVKKGCDHGQCGACTVLLDGRRATTCLALAVAWDGANITGMTMGLSMALHEQSVLDERLGQVVNHDFASYHIASSADVRDLQAIWLDEVDGRSTPIGSRGIGETGIVGAAAIANAVHHATGRRVRELPLTPEKLLE
jgi:hypothetical protein